MSRYKTDYQGQQSAILEQRAEEAWGVCAECKTPYVRADLREGRAGRLICGWHFNRGVR